MSKYCKEKNKNQEGLESKYEIIKAMFHARIMRMKTNILKCKSQRSLKKLPESNNWFYGESD